MSNPLLVLHFLMAEHEFFFFLRKTGTLSCSEVLHSSDNEKCIMF